MRMGYEALLAKKLIKPFKARDQQIKRQMELVIRDLKVAKAMLGVNNDWTYSIAYNGILQAVRALMYAKGFRPVGEGQHKTAIIFAELALGEKFEDEAKQSLVFAKKFVGRIEEVLKERR
jgi:uncharacterized protein (UPF0332 family)